MSKEKIRNALDRYYKAFDYDDGTLAYKRGGQMGFGKKFYFGGDEDEVEVSDEDLGAGESGSKSWKDIFDFSDTKWGGLAGTAVGLIGDTVGGFRDMADKNAQLERSVNQYGTGAFNNVYDNTSLLSAIGNTPGLTNISKSDIRNKTVGQDIGSAFSTGLSAGLSTGNVFVGIGAGLLDAGKSIAQRLKAKSYADRVNQYIKDKNISLNKQAFMASQGVDAHNDWMRMMSYYMNPYDYALGGEMRTHGANFNNGLTFINEGGTHEQNPYEGVPSGVDDEGVPNLVEEGEVIWNNEYVFSNRIKIPKHLAKKYKLGGNLTFADAIKEVTKESLTRPNDPISNETNKAIVNEFMDEQEALREEEQQKAARQLQTAYDEDFMSQLDAIQGMTPPINSSIDMGQVGMEMPNEIPVTEGNMAPPGFAFGGNKFEGGGYRVVKVGNRYFITSEGAPNITGTMYGNRFVVDDQFKSLPSFDSFEEANREAERMKREAMPALEYQADIEASSIVSNTGNKILREQTGYDTKGKPTYRYIVTDPNSGKVYHYYSYETAARKYSSIPRKVSGVKGGYAYVTPYGDIHKTEKGAKSALDSRLHPQSTSTKTTNSSTSRDSVAAAVATKMPEDFNAQLQAILDTTGQSQDTVSIPVSQQPAVAPSVTQAQETQTPKASATTAATTRTPNKASGSTGRMTTPSGNTINYRRDINGKEWESAEPYQNFLSYMRGKGKDSPEAKEWMEFIQNEIKNSGSKYTLKDFDDWSHLAEDGKVGPVHQATLKAAEYFAKRSGLQAINPNRPTNLIEPTLEQALGVKPDAPYGIPTFSVPQTISGNKLPKNTGFNYKDTRLRYAPVVGSAMAALYGMANRPDYSNADAIIEAARLAGAPVNIPVQTIGDYMAYKPFDERYLVNMANQNRAAATRGITNTAGGNRAMDLLGNMSLAHNNQQELGEIARQAYLANQQQRSAVAEFNRGTNIQNMGAINQRNLAQAQLNSQRQATALSGLERGHSLRQSIKDTWDAATMESLNSVLTSLGAIGKENEEYNILTSMAENGYFPHYYGDRSIIKFNPYTGEKLVKNGGNLNRKKRRF